MDENLQFQGQHTFDIKKIFRRHRNFSLLRNCLNCVKIEQSRKYQFRKKGNSSVDLSGNTAAVRSATAPPTAICCSHCSTADFPFSTIRQKLFTDICNCASRSQNTQNNNNKHTFPIGPTAAPIASRRETHRPMGALGEGQARQPNDTNRGKRCDLQLGFFQN